MNKNKTISPQRHEDTTNDLQRVTGAWVIGNSSVPSVTSVDKRRNVVSLCRCGKKNAAFTLVELLTVIAIMVIIAAVSIPAFAALFANNNMVQAQNQLSAAIAETRALAIRNHTEVALIFFEEPGHTGETAFAYEQESPGQGDATSTSQIYFQPIPQQSVQYLPKGVYVATLVGTADSDGTTANNSNGVYAGLAMPLGAAVNAAAPSSSTSPASPLQPNATTPGGAPLRAIVFDGNGHLVIVNSMVTQEPETIDKPGSTTPITWWDGLGGLNGDGTPSTYDAYGPSSPGFMLVQPSGLPTTDTDTQADLATYLIANSDVTIISTYTGNVVQ